jgi:ribosomal protein L31
MSSTKLPPTLICPSCGSEINVFLDNKGRAKSEDIFTMRLITPIYISAGTVKEKQMEVYVCSKCHTIIGTGSKM